MTYIDAIREAQEKLLREDDRVFLYGQDIATFGGAFKATKGLAEQFPNRVFDAPISEDAMIGMAVGAAIEGMRPIVEMQFADFSSVAFNQIVNQAATHFYRTGVPIPITVRLPSGGTPGSGPFHSQSMEGIYAQYPGLVVLTPATVSDAYHMLIDGVALDDPVIFCEHKFLYRWLKAKSINGDHLPIGQARIIRPGKHATVVAYSAMVHEAVRAADRLQQDGWEIEVVDLRSVKPLDVDTILASVARTGRLLAVGEAFPWGGVTAEVISRVTEEGFHLLDAPPQRLERPRHAGSLSPETLGRPPPDAGIHLRSAAQTAHFLIPAFQNLQLLPRCPPSPFSCHSSANPSPRPPSSASESRWGISSAPTRKSSRWKPTRR